MATTETRWWRALLAVAAAAAAALFLRRKPPAGAPAAAAPAAAPPPPRRATQRDERAAEKLIARERRWQLREFGLELALVIVVAAIAVPAIVIAHRGNTAMVLVHDVRQGDRIDPTDVEGVALPQLDHVFAGKQQFKDLIALRDLPGGSVVRTSDVGRPQAVATANIAAGELLDAAKNIAFKPLPYVDNAVTPAPNLRKQARQFIATGSVISTKVVADAPATPVNVAPGDVEVPLRAFAGALAPSAGSEVTVVATPRGSGSAAAVFEHVRVLSADSTREPATLLVAMTQAEAMRFAALPPADFTLMRPRR